MRPPTMHALLLSSLLLAALLPGCGLTMLASGLQASETGVSLVGRTGVERFELARLGDALVAARHAIHTLRLDVEGLYLDGNTAVFELADATGSQVTVRVHARTDMLTYIEVDSGLFGEIALAQVVSLQITDELLEMNAVTERWGDAGLPD